MKTYNKLVRDLIPEVIKKSGKECDIEIANMEQRTGLLEAKLMEEVNEYLEDKNLEELADVMEVLFGIAHNLGYTEEDLLNKRKEKLEERGGFKKGIILKKVY
ncbi:nucleoside triphosphate pyrophosphohydrolase [Clostridium saudiense]|uniref:Nucleoside triphosphate pyrophosphohydrolase n=1 Tax=Clostridium saudiense TaxID=1414720 RepID=A0ABS2FG50_9CLOT|nr:nucleoside triphosphate pyrophosphohydrolase [Clostridium saudiense]MBM6819329.1 nucleoside triphosphate pyrophosphohydrolase [Clostridium saudiense]